MIETLQKEAQAKAIVRKLFVDAVEGEMSREAVLGKISLKTFHNYMSLLVAAGLIETVKDDADDSRRVTKWVLTERGKQALHDADNNVAADAGSDGGRKTDNTDTKVPEIIPLEFVKIVTDRWNAQNPSYWIDPPLPRTRESTA